MAGGGSSLVARTRRRGPDLAALEPRWMRGLLIAIALTFLALFLVVPLVVVFASAFRDGIGTYLRAITEPDTLSAVKLTLLAAGIAVPLNIVVGVAAAWAITRFQFPGKRILITLIDLPFAVSPVIAGMVFILLFGAGSAIGPWLTDHGVRIVFAVPAILLATCFVTFPFVARELIPALEARGPEQELAALTLGATGWYAFRTVTLPNVRWALYYGAILCTARAVGEFGAVSVVSGHIRGETNTVPLHVEILFNEYHFAASFAVSTLLVLVALSTLALKSAIEWRVTRVQTSAPAAPGSQE
jgi:sulfate/thiosulfate transport system permease protein